MQCGVYEIFVSHKIFFREINYTVKTFTKEVVFTEIFQKNRDTKILYSVWHLVMQIFCEIDLQVLLSDFENPNFRTGYLKIGWTKFQTKII